VTVRATTRLCGVVGDPVAHSLSPAMHNAAFAYLGLDFAYVALPVATADLAAAIDGARALGFVGLNVTLPHKEAALSCCEPDELARAVGAVNTIVFDGGRARGTNTDVHGVDQSLGDARIGRAVVVGAGGAARAAIYALDRRGVDVEVLARTARPLGARRTIALDDGRASTVLSRADLVIDATPIGLGEGPIAWPIDVLPPSVRVIDLVARASTPLLRAAQAQRLAVKSGADMLLHQGALAFELFTQRRAPVDVMRRALRDALDAAEARPT